MGEDSIERIDKLFDELFVQLESDGLDDLDKIAEALERIDWADFSEEQKRRALCKVEAVIKKILQKQKEIAFRMQNKEHIKKYLS